MCTTGDKQILKEFLYRYKSSNNTNIRLLKGNPDPDIAYSVVVDDIEKELDMVF